MALAHGTRLGPYEVTAQIGVGGMGEVYRAIDTNLKRAVAIKVLPEPVAGDVDRLARFQREAEVLASLNHPNIAQIYGIEKSAGMTGLIMELVEGPTLADRIAQGPISLDEALPIAKQIAEALEAAHERGIIHRDLKPANIKLRPDGAVKVLDFGLAKMTEPTSAMSSSHSLSPTITTPAMTQMGMLLGTAAYMSPEQAKGRPADKRSDVWAFGCVLYEMLTGRRAFEGDDVGDTLASVLKSQPQWQALPEATPASIRRLLKRSVEKDRTLRLPELASARLEIEEALRDDPADSREPARSARGRIHMTWAAVSALVALTTATAAIWLRPSSSVPVEIRLEITTPPATDPTSIALSADGSAVVFQATANGRQQLWLRRLHSSIAEPLARTEDAYLPFWSPDGQSIGFFAGGRLKRIDLDGAVVRDLAAAQVARGGAWSAAGVILFVGGTNATVFRLPATGGEVTSLLTLPPDSGIFQLHRPHFLPDGTHFIFGGSGRGAGMASLFAADLNGGPPQRLFDGDPAEVAYAANHLFFIRQGTLFAHRFDPGTLSFTGAATAVAENVAAVGAASDPDTLRPLLVYRIGPPGARARQRELVWLDRRTGSSIGRVGEPYPATAGNPALSPDGATIAVAHAGASASDLWLVDTKRGVPTRLTTDPFINNSPVWSPDGTRLVFQSNPNGVLDLFEITVNDDRQPRLVLTTPEAKMATDWHGDVILYQSVGVNTGWDLWAVSMEGAREPRLVLRTPYDERNGQFSPDGDWIAYSSDEAGTSEVYLRRYPDGGRAIRVSPAGGAQPRWRRDGRELFYVALDDRMMAVPINAAADGTPEPGTPVPLFVTDIGGALQNVTLSPTRQQYMVSPDGSRFLMNNVVAQDTSASPLAVIVNWRSEP